jgi:hypothetical protein
MATKYGDERDNPMYLEGWKAHQRGVKYEDNPHYFDTDEWQAWNQGWDAALTHDITDGQKGTDHG